MKQFYCTFIFIILLSISAFAQNPAQTPPADDGDQIKISTNLIQVDITVTDKDGKIVTDLKPEEVEIFENGKRQDVTNFSFVAASAELKKQSAENQKNTKGQIAVPIPPIKLKQEQVRRTYALVVDDLALSFESTYWLQQSLRKFVREQMAEGDLVAIVRTGSGIGALQSFTSDKRQLLAAIDKIKFNFSGRVGVSAFSPISPTFKDQLSGELADGTSKTVVGGEADKEFEKQIEEFRSENFAVGTIGALNYIIRGMRDLPGRKSLMLFSEGFQVLSRSGDRVAPSRILNAMRLLADLANRSSVVIYTLDPRGLQVPGMLQASDNTYLMERGKVEELLQSRNDELIDTQQSLRYLAYETGGFPFVNQNNINKGLQRAIDDQQGYYLLGYEPDSSTFDPRKSKFNKLEIKVTRPGLEVRYRSGFFGITDEKIRNIKQTKEQKIFSALTSPFSASEVSLVLYPIYANEAKGDYIRALVHINANDLKFTETAQKKYKANFDLVAMTFGDNGIPVDELSKNYTIEVEEKVYQNILKKGFVYDLSVPIKKAGAYQFRIALLDSVSDKIGSASQFIEVPNLKKKKLTLSNLIVEGFSPGEWKNLALGQKSEDADRSVFLDTTLRKFNAGSYLRYTYAIYNAKTDKALKTDLQVQTRVIRDGKVIFENQPAPVKTEGQTDLRRIQTSGAVKLGSSQEPGTYILQIIVIDKADTKKPRVTTQFAEFEIEG